jgi:hypothetical protein
MVSLLKADILIDAHGEDSDISIIDKHMARLDEWYYGLPIEMRLAALLSDQGSPLSISLTRGLLFLHVTFLGAILLLHRRLLASVAAAHLRDLTSHSLPDKLITYSGRPATAARQIAEIFSLVDYEKNVFRRCWLCMCVNHLERRSTTANFGRSEVYASSAVLLFIASCKLAARDAAGCSEDLSRASRLTQMLSAASTVDSVARRLYNLLRPLCAALDELRETAANSIPGPAETVDFDHRCHAAMQKSINHVQNVFGSEDRLDIVDVGRSELHIPTWWT